MLNRSVLLGAMLLAASCSGGGGESKGTGGAPGTGGVTATGGAATGGTGTGGRDMTATGGATSTGGVTSTGGSASGGTATGGSSTGGAGGAVAPGTGGTSGGGTCTRASLQETINAYLKALVAHDASGAPLATTVRYTENTKEVKIGEGLWKIAGAVKLQRDLFDTVQCTSFSQVVLPEDGADSVISQRLKVESGKITESEAIITRKDDWNFDAMGYINTKAKLWEVLPADQRTPRDKLITMPKVYWDYFKDNMSAAIPFGTGCKRVEGGKGAPIDCTVGIPKGVNIGDRRFWADEEAGVSVGIALFGGTSGLLDVHYFKMISGTIREVYAMTTNTRFTGTGWPGGVQ